MDMNEWHRRSVIYQQEHDEVLLRMIRENKLWDAAKYISEKWYGGAAREWKKENKH